MDSRLKTSGMTKGGLNMSGMTEDPLWPLCHARRGPFVMPAGPFVMPAGPPLSCPPAPLSCPPGALCHSRRLLAGIQGLSLPSLSSCDPAWEKVMDSRLKTSGMTEGRSEHVGDDREAIENIGHDRGVIENTGHDGGAALAPLTEGLLWPLCRARRAPLSYLPAPLCHARRPPSVMPAGPSLSCPPAPLCHARRPPSVIPTGC